MHGPFALGGLAIPHLHTVQGIDKLHLFSGHLRLEDDTGTLIVIDLGLVQLLICCSTFFLNEDPANFTWVESGWITSLRHFIHIACLTIIQPDQWLPSSPCKGDLYLMEFFAQQQLRAKHLRTLNQCHLYLQVITLSDIVSDDGSHILTEVKLGQVIPGRESKLDWPQQGWPNKLSWKLWAQQLERLEIEGRLWDPLGAWIAHTHQRWKVYAHVDTKVLNVENGNSCQVYPPIYVERQVQTWSSCLPWYDISNPLSSTVSLPEQAVPATITVDRLRQGMLAQTSLSSNRLLTAPPLPHFISPLAELRTNVLAGISKEVDVCGIVEAASEGKLFISSAAMVAISHPQG